MSVIEDFNLFEVERVFCQGCRQDFLESELRPIKIEHYRNSIKLERGIIDTFKLFITKTVGKSDGVSCKYNSNTETNRILSFEAFHKKYSHICFVINPVFPNYSEPKPKVLNYESRSIYSLINYCEARCTYYAKNYCLKCWKGYCGVHWDKILKICKSCRNKTKQAKKRKK